MLLSICIPTYNRHEELVALHANLLEPVLRQYADRVEIVVSDNSDPGIADANRAILHEGIRYSRNQVNLGYAGNIKRCITLSNGDYLWIMSDDDKIEWRGFLEVIGILESSEKADVLILKTRTTTSDGRIVIVPDNWVFDSSSPLRMRDLLGRNFLPFLFIGGYID